MSPIVERILIHGLTYVIWMFMVLLIVPFGWLVLNGALWEIGHGDVLAQRPVAAVHHRIVGTFQAIDNHREAIGYYEGHLRGSPRASAESRRLWEVELTRERAELRWLRVKVFGGATAGYVIIALLWEAMAAGWRRRNSGRNDTLAGVIV